MCEVRRRLEASQVGLVAAEGSRDRVARYRQAAGGWCEERGQGKGGGAAAAVSERPRAQTTSRLAVWTAVLQSRVYQVIIDPANEAQPFYRGALALSFARTGQLSLNSRARFRAPARTEIRTAATEKTWPALAISRIKLA